MNDGDEEDLSPRNIKSKEELEIEIIDELQEKGDEAHGFNFTDPEKPNSFDFLEIDNDYENDNCRVALENGGIELIREKCISYCHKYSFWFFSGSIYRDIDKLKNIFDFIKKFLIDDLNFDASEIPEKVDMKESDLFNSKRLYENVFEDFNYYFGAEGINKDSLFEWET